MFKRFKKIANGIICALIVYCGTISGVAYADGYGIGVSPMNERIILTPGETYNGSFLVTNPSNNTGAFSYKITVAPFYVTEDYDIYYEGEGDYNQIVDWLTVENPTGVLEVNTVKTINYAIKVPKSAPAGGQYAAIRVISNTAENVGEDSNVQLSQAIGISHIIYAEVAGNSVRDGGIESIDLPGFLFSGNITGSALIKNTGNVHGVAKYTLQVFPLFSDEEVYTNEEEPNTLTILPGRSRYNETSWNYTPAIGIFNVVYTVEYEGTTAQISKMVIKCPIWLLLIIIFIILAIIIWLVMRIRSRARAKKEA